MRGAGADAVVVPGSGLNKNSQGQGEVRNPMLEGACGIRLSGPVRGAEAEVVVVHRSGFNKKRSQGGVYYPMLEGECDIQALVALWE